MDEIALPAVAWMPNMDYLDSSGELMGHVGSVIADGNEAPRPEHPDELGEEFLSKSLLAARMRSVGEGLVCLMWVKGEHVPEKDGHGYLGEHSPDDRSGPLGNDRARCRSLNAKIPPDSMGTQMNVIGERKAGAPAAPVAKIPPDPDCVDFRLGRGSQHL